jgi:hypothetical protein
MESGEILARRTLEVVVSSLWYRGHGVEHFVMVRWRFQQWPSVAGEGGGRRQA